MRSAFSYIVRPKEERTTSVHKTDSGEIILNTDLQNHSYVSRQGIVLSTPLFGNSEVKKDDEVILHHNVFRRFYDVRGKEKWSKSYFENDLWFAQEDQIYAYKRKNKWRATEGFCFVKPVKEDNEFSLHKEKPLTGVLVYIDNSLKEQGIKAGALIGFKPGSEYEFVIDGKRLYRIPTKFITIKYEHRGNKEEYNTSWEKGS